MSRVGGKSRVGGMRLAKAEAMSRRMKVPESD